MKNLVKISLCLALSTAFAADEDKVKEVAKNAAQTVLQKNNSWNVIIDNDKSIKGYIYATLVKRSDYWEIDNFYANKPDVTKSSKLELFATTPDLFYWTNVSNDMVKDCDKDNSKYYNVCSSAFANKKTSAAVIGILFGGDGSVLTGYIDEKVAEAIHSIPVEQANIKLSEFKIEFQKQQEIEKEKRKKEEDAKKEELARINQSRKDARVGAKDFCEQEVKLFNVPGALDYGIQVNSTYKCFTYGVVNEEILRADGWTIVSKQPRQVGNARKVTVHDIGIEKIR